jgi:hypothetical protein
MYHVLEPLEKLVYLAFWDDSTDKDAAQRIGDSHRSAELSSSIKKLEKIGLLIKTKKGHMADLGYMVEMIERDNHFYPERKLSAGERRVFASFLSSQAFRKLVGKRLGEAIRLSKESKDVLGGFFWLLFSGPFAIIQAYQDVFGDQPSVHDFSGSFDEYLARYGKGKKPARYASQMRNSGKFTEDDIWLALELGIAQVFPKELTGYLRWNVNQRPETYVAKEIFLKA